MYVSAYNQHYDPSIRSAINTHNSTSTSFRSHPRQATYD